MATLNGNDNHADEQLVDKTQQPENQAFSSFKKTDDNKNSFRDAKKRPYIPMISIEEKIENSDSKTQQKTPLKDSADRGQQTILSELEINLECQLTASSEDISQTSQLKTPIENITQESQQVTLLEDTNQQEHRQIAISEDNAPIMSLLQKAVLYRNLNPEKWKIQQEEQQRRIKNSFREFERDLFLEEYYKGVDAARKERKKMEKLRMLEPSKLILQLEYNLPWRNVKDRSETYKSVSAFGLSVYDKDGGIFDKFKSDRQEVRGHVPELLVTINKGKYLLNHLQEDQERYEHAKIKFQILPDFDSAGTKLKSSYSYINSKGTSRWNHVFVVKGYSSDDLARKHLLIQVSGKSSTRKDIIGEVILAGSEVLKVKYQHSKHSREPQGEEVEIFKKTLEMPGTAIAHTVNLFREGRDHSSLAAKMGLERERFNRKAISKRQS